MTPIVYRDSKGSVETINTQCTEPLLFAYVIHGPAQL